MRQLLRTHAAYTRYLHAARKLAHTLHIYAALQLMYPYATFALHAHRGRRDNCVLVHDFSSEAIAEWRDPREESRDEE